jgi:hypothetical protein
VPLSGCDILGAMSLLAALCRTLATLAMLGLVSAPFAFPNVAMAKAGHPSAAATLDDDSNGMADAGLPMEEMPCCPKDVPPDCKSCALPMCAAQPLAALAPVASRFGAPVGTLRYCMASDAPAHLLARPPPERPPRA